MRRTPPAGIVLGTALVLALGAYLFFGGDRAFSIGEIWTVLSGGQLPADRHSVVTALVLELRAPRGLMLALVGMALGVCGATLQSALQNPLADSSLLGVSGGASLGAVAALSLGWGTTSPVPVPLCAFAGAVITLLLVYTIAHATGRPTAAALLLTGVALSSLSSALVSVLLLARGEHRVHEIIGWLLGSSERAAWADLAWIGPPVALSIAALLAMRRTIDALALGEEQAMAVGVNVPRARAVLFVLVAIAAGCAVSLTGPIGFVGLIVPHMVRALTGPSARVLLPNAALGGAALLVACDLIARVVSVSVVVPVGVVTALLGVPFFLLLLARS